MLPTPCVDIFPLSPTNHCMWVTPSSTLRHFVCVPSSVPVCDRREFCCMGSMACWRQTDICHTLDRTGRRDRTGRDRDLVWEDRHCETKQQQCCGQVFGNMASFCHDNMHSMPAQTDTQTCGWLGLVGAARLCIFVCDMCLLIFLAVHLSIYVLNCPSIHFMPAQALPAPIPSLPFLQLFLFVILYFPA